MVLLLLKGLAYNKVMMKLQKVSVKMQEMSIAAATV